MILTLYLKQRSISYIAFLFRHTVTLCLHYGNATLQNYVLDIGPATFAFFLAGLAKMLLMVAAFAGAFIYKKYRKTHVDSKSNMNNVDMKKMSASDRHQST